MESWKISEILMFIVSRDGSRHLLHTDSLRPNDLGYGMLQETYSSKVNII